MSVEAARGVLEDALALQDGILRLEPAWVARDFVPPGRRLGLPDDSYDMGERGYICERWLASTTRADNLVGPADEGLSYIALDGSTRLSLREAVASDPAGVMGADYAATHAGLGRLAKVFDYSARLPLHLHLRQEHAALVGRKSKDEAYYFPEGVDMGPHPETFLGVHPWISETGQHEVLLPYLRAWDSDEILKHTRGYQQVAGEGFHVPSGVLHAPGTAVTIELQEDSDVLAMLQALNAGRIISKELLWKDVRQQDKERYGERFILELIDWKQNGDPYFYENHHLSPRLVEASQQAAGEEYWIFYNTSKFSGKKLIVRAGQTYLSRERGVHSIFVLEGAGSYGGLDIRAGVPGLDELLITHSRAIRDLPVQNTGDRDLVVVKFFGPDIYLDAPLIPEYPGSSAGGT
jgi:mannose-6-phosphate isomerase class I